MNENDKQAEPVAIGFIDHGGIAYWHNPSNTPPPDGTMLYTHPAQPVQADDLRQAALIDLAYINGAKAGWNMCVADDESQFKKLTEGVVECVRVLKNTRSQATTQPVQPAAAINEQLLEALKELMYARTDKAEGMADAAIAAAEAEKARGRG